MNGLYVDETLFHLESLAFRSLSFPLAFALSLLKFAQSLCFGHVGRECLHVGVFSTDGRSNLLMDVDFLLLISVRMVHAVLLG